MRFFSRRFFWRIWAVVGGRAGFFLYGARCLRLRLSGKIRPARLRAGKFACAIAHFRIKVLHMKYMKGILVAAFSTFAAIVAFGADENAVPPNIEWRDMRSVGLEGKGWQDTSQPYGRMPSSAKGKATNAVMGNAVSSTGMCINFETDAREIWVKRKFRQEKLGESNFNICAHSGFDLYCADKNDGGKFKWLAATSHRDSNKEVYKLFGANGRKNVYRIYLPLRNCLVSAELGIPKGAYFKVIPARKEKPLVFYGTSIVHGAFASHAGLSHPSIIGRRLDKPVINLGFSGSAKMEIEMADILAELDAAVYIIDCQPNMDEKLVESNCEKFLRRLRQLRPDTPILLVEHPNSARDWYWKGKNAKRPKKCYMQRDIYKKLCDEGEKNMLYLKGDTLYGTHGESSIDDIHPGDLGMMELADQMTPLIGELLKKNSAGS